MTNHFELGNGTVIVDVDDGIGTITLNRPEARNALSSELLAALPIAFDFLEADEATDILVLTGTDPAFCAGLDLRELGDSNGNIRTDGNNASKGPFPERTKPLIAAVNGVAVTGGFELALACDFIIASERASFADTHARVGVMPGWGLSVLLPQAIGIRRSRELSLTGNYLDASRAYDWGLVNQVVKHQDLMGTVRGLAQDIRTNDQLGVRQLLKTYDLTSSTNVETAWGIENEMGQDWLKQSGFTAEKVAERREAIQNRGRSQTL
ncbi:MAG: enoyl-CoA hydratase [Actinomycetota bacterium]|jgi:enoyl-CoA hydratase|nr:enoyl-CoA hydratase [Acidimicrobiales bacterium]